MALYKGPSNFKHKTTMLIYSENIVLTLKGKFPGHKPIISLPLHVSHFRRTYHATCAAYNKFHFTNNYTAVLYKGSILKLISQ